MPGIHRVFGLGRSFSLLEVEPGRSVAIGVHREPGAALALLGGLLLAAGLLVRVGRARGTPDGSAAEALAPGLVPGAALLALLLLVDRGAVVAWSFGVPSGAGRVPLPGAGVLFGAYAMGEPTKDSEVFVTANYKLTFDMVRRSLAGLDAWVLVLDTKSINVWCAAGKGTFGLTSW